MITPYRTTEDIKTLSKEQLIDVSKAIHKEVVLYSMIRTLVKIRLYRCRNDLVNVKHLVLFMNPKDHPEIFLVTGKKVDGQKDWYVW